MPLDKALGLDDEDASPHPEDMAKPPDPAKTKPDAREAKLAQALRANLRRRKSGSDAKSSGAGPSRPPRQD